MTIRHLLLGASACAALTLAAGASLAQGAGPGDVCLDDGCTMISLFGLPVYCWLLWNSWFRANVVRQVSWKGRDYKF